MTRVANKIFEAMSQLAEVRHIYQREEPKFNLSAPQKTRAFKHLCKAKEAIVFVEKAFKKACKRRKGKRKL